MGKSKRGKQKPVLTNQPTGKTAQYKSLLKVVVGAVVLGLIGALVWLPKENQAGTPVITVYKSPTCGCCAKWIDHMENAGFKVITHNRQEMGQIKEEHGVEYKLRSCHTAIVEDYVLEGHVPAGDVRRLLKERPAVDGLAVPGMPAGSPGMEGEYADPYEVIAFAKGKRNMIFARY
jgi:hypothetical protein